MTRTAKIAIVTLLVLLLGGTMWFLHGRRSAALQERQLERAAVQKKLEAAEALLAKYKADKTAMEKELASKLTEMGGSGSLAADPSVLERLLNEHHLKLVSPIERIDEDGPSFKVEVGGKNSDLVRFFEDLSKSPGITSVSDLGLEFRKDPPDSVKASFRVSVFRFRKASMTR